MGPFPFFYHFIMNLHSNFTCKQYEEFVWLITMFINVLPLIIVSKGKRLGKFSKLSILKILVFLEELELLKEVHNFIDFFFLSVDWLLNQNEFNFSLSEDSVEGITNTPLDLVLLTISQHFHNLFCAHRSLRCRFFFLLKLYHLGRLFRQSTSFSYATPFGGLAFQSSSLDLR